MSSQTEAACTGPAKVCSRWGQHAPIPKPKVISNWQLPANENLISLQGSLPKETTTLKGRLNAHKQMVNRKWTQSYLFRFLVSYVMSGFFLSYFLFLFYLYDFYFSLFTLQVLCIYIMAFSLVFLWGSWVCEQVGLCFLCLHLWFFSACFAQFWFVSFRFITYYIA